jgi:hypothetical protein
VADQRPDQGVLLQRVADGQPPVGVRQPLRELVDHRVVRDDAAHRGAALAGRPGGGEHDAAHR